MNLDDDIYRPAGLGGEGWWDDAVDTVKTVAKKVQKNPVVRGLEKRAVKAGTTALRGATETAVDGLADSALTALGAPELAPMANKLVDKGVSYLQKKGTDYLDQQIDASGRGYGGVRYMSPAGGGLRLAGHGTQVGTGLRLAGSGHVSFGDFATAVGKLGVHEMTKNRSTAGSGHGVPAGYHRMPDGSIMANRDHQGMGHCGCGHMAGHGLRLAGSGLRLAGQGMYRQVGLVEGSGHGYC